MDVVVDLNVLRGDKFKGDNYIIPLLLIIELLDSDSINYDRKMKLLEKIKNREYEIDKRHPRTFFCEAIGEKNRDQDVYDIFIENLLNSSFTNIVGFKELIEYNKLTAIKFDNSFVQLCISRKNIEKATYTDQIKYLKNKYVDCSIRVHLMDDDDINIDNINLGSMTFSPNINEYIKTNLPESLSNKFELLKEKYANKQT